MACKLVILVHKRDGLTDEEFHKYWSERHPKVFLKAKVVQEKVISYTQYHVNSRDTAAYNSIGVAKGQVDGIVNITTATLDDLRAVFEDEEYLRDVVPDEAQFLNRVDAVMMIGHDEHKKINGIVQEGVL